MHAPTTPTLLIADNHLLCVSKPAGMPVQPDDTGVESLYDWAKGWIRSEKNKIGGDVFCGIVHRLDRNATGAIVLARTSKAAARLSKQWAARTVRKEYAVLVSPAPPKASDTLRHHLVKNERTRRVTVHAQSGPGTREAITRYKIAESAGDVAMLRVWTETGRPHQIRAQLAHAGAPILGDRKYGSEVVYAGLALHARCLEFEHPTRHEPVEVVAPLPEHWRELVPG